MNWILGHPFFKQIAILISHDIWSAPQNLWWDANLLRYQQGRASKWLLYIVDVIEYVDVGDVCSTATLYRFNGI